MISFQAIHFVPPQGDQIGVDCCWPEGLWGAARGCIQNGTNRITMYICIDPQLSSRTKYYYNQLGKRLILILILINTLINLYTYKITKQDNNDTAS